MIASKPIRHTKYRPKLKMPDGFGLLDLLKINMCKQDAGKVKNREKSHRKTYIIANFVNKIANI